MSKSSNFTGTLPSSKCNKCNRGVSHKNLSESWLRSYLVCSDTGGCGDTGTQLTVALTVAWVAVMLVIRADQLWAATVRLCVSLLGGYSSLEASLCPFVRLFCVATCGVVGPAAPLWEALPLCGWVPVHSHVPAIYSAVRSKYLVIAEFEEKLILLMFDSVSPTVSVTARLSSYAKKNLRTRGLQPQLRAAVLESDSAKAT